MNGYADLHCHILPGTDDGPGTLEEARDMLHIARAEGITDIVATPHFAPSIPGFDGAGGMEAFPVVAAMAQSMGITLHPGTEIFLDEYAHAALKAGRCLPLGDSRHVLLELPDRADLAQHHGWMTAFLSDGWIPILAHVERLEALQADPQALEEWTDAGCLLQVNASTLLGGWTDIRRRTAKTLIKHGMCHLIATDAHSPGSRAPLVQAACRKVGTWVGEAEALRLLRDTPRRILGLPAWT